MVSQNVLNRLLNIAYWSIKNYMLQCVALGACARSLK